MRSRTRLVVALVAVGLVGWLVFPSVLRSQEWPRTPETRAVRQGSDWSIAHIQSTIHVGGALEVRDKTCLTCTARVDHYNALVVQPHISGALRTWQVSQCGTTASLRREYRGQDRLPGERVGQTRLHRVQ